MFSWFKFPSKKKLPDGKNPNVPRATGVYSRSRGAVPMFVDFPTELDPACYALIYEHDTTYTPLLKRARKCGSFVPTVVGGGARGIALGEVLDNCIGVPMANEWLSYADVEGWRGLWLRVVGLGKMNVINFMSSGIKKVRAGGDWWWDGNDGSKVIRFGNPLTMYGGQEQVEDVSLDRDRVCIFAPTVDENPEGDTRMGYLLGRVAWMSRLLEEAEQCYTERHSKPREIIYRVLEEMEPTDVESALENTISLMEPSTMRSNLASMSHRDRLDIIEPKGKTYEFLTHLRLSLNARAHKIVMGENLSTDSSGSGDAGSAELAEKQFFSTASYIMKMASEPWTSQILPFLESANDYWLPPALKKDPPMYVAFKPPVEKQRISPAELFGAIDRRVPLKLTYIYDVLGTEGEHDPDDYYVLEQPVKEETMPSTDGGAEQRSDREVPDSGMPAKRKRKEKRKDAEDDGESDDE